MGKRTLDETSVENPLDGAENGPSSKKLRKEQRRKEKLDRANGVETNGAKDSSKESKEERRERKRLRKLELGSDNANTETTPNGKDQNSNAIDADNTEEKQQAARKAQKAELKAIKRATKQAKKDAKPKETIGPSPIEPSSSSVNEDYTEHAGLKTTSQTEIDAYLSKNFIGISDPVTSNKPLRPITAFDYLPQADAAQSAIFKTFSSPTPIQAAAWPYLFSKRDVIGVAETGSGKTLAFAVPCVRYISALRQSEDYKASRGVKAVMVSPTRELALQIHEQVVKIARPAGLEVVCVYGGVSKDAQKHELKKASIIVATPGRLNDLINEGAADLSNVCYLVLDEADRMLDKGFEQDIKRIITTTLPTPKRQTLMFTATWPPSVSALASTFMTRPVKITIGDNPSGDLRANTSITQRVEVVDPRAKEQRLLQLLRQHQSGAQASDRILVFCLYKKEATRIEGFLRARGLPIAGIHGDYSQPQRTASLDAFRSGKTPLLVATDVAARGLDIPAVKLVINVTFPLTVEDYVHRIGRTGRAGAKGLAITLFTEHDKAHSGALINVLKAANQPVPDELLKFGTTVKKKSHEAYGAFFKDVDTDKKATKIRFDD
ncbi:MAG: RNA-dependent ATPase [Sarcosagium campestre]|nr:MAG: RNA-dependent ATPase [Sarcosagium campestre]